MARPVKVFDRNHCKPRQQEHRDDERHHHAHRQIDEAETQRGVDIAGLHVAIVDAEDEDQHALR